MTYFRGTTGSPGPAGPAGPAGPTGATGPAGPTGATGATGPAGADGAPGADGTSFTIIGPLASTADLPATGSAGDGYLISGHLWVWTTGTSSWTDAGLIQGPAGPTGPAGATGATGPAGPTGATGAVGPAGPAGPQGPQGDKGDPGTPGTGGGGLGGVVDVVADYGADPTGVADSLAAFNNARNSGAAKVWIPPGNYKLSAVLTWDDEVALEGASSRAVTLNSYGAGFGIVHRPSSSGSRVPMRGFILDGTHNTQAATLCGFLVQRKVLSDDVVVKNFNGAGARYAPYDASTSTGLGGTIGNAVFFSRWTDCVFSDNGGDGMDVRMGANDNGFTGCQFIRNKGHGFHHRTDGGATYGNWIQGGQASYNSGHGYYLESGTDLTTRALYTEYNHSPTNTNTDGYTGSPVDIYVGDNCSRSDIQCGVLLSASSTHVRAPAAGLNDSCVVYAGGQRIFGSTKYQTGHRVAGPAASTATDVATLKADLNALRTALIAGGHLS